MKEQACNRHPHNKRGHTLTQQEDIIMQPAGRGRTSVLTDRETYRGRIKDLLKDNNTHRTLKKDPTEQMKKTLKTILQPLLNEEKNNPGRHPSHDLWSTQHRISHIQPEDATFTQVHALEELSEV